MTKQREKIASLHDLVRDRVQRSLDTKQKLLFDASFRDLTVKVALCGLLIRFVPEETSFSLETEEAPPMLSIWRPSLPDSI